MQPHSELKTIKDYLRYALSRFSEAGLFYGHGTDNAWDEAMLLILHSLHLPHTLSPDMLDARLTSDEKNKLHTMIHRRIDERIPAAYLTRKAWFAHMPFYVDERVLIPRSPVAELIEQHFEPWVQSDNVHNILDLCCGSACIAIACAKAFPEASIDASDISDDALAVAKINVLKHQLEDQVNLIQSDLFNQLNDKKYDIIVSNPPYVSQEEMANLPDEYRHEPILGLASGESGLNCVDDILKQADKHLNPNGILICEVGNSEVALEEKYPTLPCTWLEFERGGGGVFMLTAEELRKWRENLA